MARSRSRSRERRRRSRSRSGERKPRDRSRERDRDREDRGKRRYSRERRSRSRSPYERRRSRSRDRRGRDRDDGRRGRDSRSPHDRKRRDDRRAQAPISLDQIANCEQDVSALMGFEGFNTTKNRKVAGNYEGAVKINKPRRYRQYMNRKGSVISVDCGEFGYYQGRLISLDAESKDIVLASAFKEGIPLGKNLTLNGSQIVSLKVLKPAQPSEDQQTASTSDTQLEKKERSKKANGTEQNGVVHRSKSTIEFTTEGNTNNEHKRSGRQARPLAAVQNKSRNAPVLRKTSSVSSTSEDGQCVPVVDRIPKERTRNRKIRRSESEHNHSQALCLSETPQFRRFGPQVPLPREVLAAKVKSRGKPKGPSGDPLLDSRKLRGKIANGNDELVKPIDFDLLNTDFDFAANLEQFKREDVDDEYYQTMEKPKMSQNFAHYENIVDDPTRCTSWTNVLGTNKIVAGSARFNASSKSPSERRSPPVRSISFCPSGYETTYDGFPLPILDAALKKKYLQECCSTMGSDVYFHLVADRLIMWLIDVVGSCSTTVYGKFPSLDFGSVTIVDHVSALPTTSKVVVVLADDLTAEAQTWLSKQKSAHIITLECVPSLIDHQKLHILMLGVLTSGLYSSSASAQPQLGKTSFAQLCAAIKSSKFIDSAVCDVGAPFSWIAEDGKANLQQAFSTTLIRRLC
ncbi:hypothetical protein NECAME_00984 [Necator americanus]|uniref:FDF domain-containing protein n=1 Tax=Necator americanus TaxID=51031 RepID=W2SMD4_NECAM|nr:hypothetical protein NECAME_00984 [Necator americanus]ETN70036.1 hypothetical protein NECAME_00984 [Necator americanus]